MKTIALAAFVVTLLSTQAIAKGKPIAIGDDGTDNPGAIVFGECKGKRACGG